MSINAHAIHIHQCVECPFVGEPEPEQKLEQCTHPDRSLGDDLAVELEAPPPPTCPMRAKPVLLLIAVPPETRAQRRARKKERLH